MVECDLAKVEVASSNLVSRSKLQGKKQKVKGKTRTLFLPFTFLLLPFPRGGVAKW